MLWAASAAASPWIYNRTTIRLRRRSPYSRRWIHTHRSAYLLCAKQERWTEKETETEKKEEIVSVQGVKETQKDKLSAQTLVQCCHHH
jgi:hypothetical protein